MSEINVTPFVDVMLVLLVVFMVAAPLITIGLPIDLPKGDAPTLNDQETPITITMARDGAMFVGEDATTLETLIPQLLEQTEGETGRLIKIEGDQNLLYGNVTETMSVLYQAGFDRVRLIMERPSNAR
ncbi:MAG: ExbD/TolR family protein [Alphaproteobacteria bacterium]|jgi:biopolymer transport protein TolR